MTIRTNFFRKFMALSGAVLMAAPLGAQDIPPMTEEARPVTLREAIELAQRNTPAAVQARGLERNAAAQRRSAYGAFLPNLNISASSNRTQGVQFFQGQFVPLQGNPWNYSNGVGASLELFDGGRRFAELARVRASEQVADLTMLNARFDAALQVKQQFYAALAARESEAAARAQLQQAEQQLRASSARVAAGVATKSDSLRSVIQVGNARLAVLTAQNDLRVANAALTRIAGSEVTLTPAPSDTLVGTFSIPSEEELLRLVNEAPAIRLAEANVVTAKAAKRTQRTSYLPTLNMSYNYSTNQSSKTFAGDNIFLLGGQNPNRQTMSFSLQYNIFNGFTREANAVQADVSLRNAEAQLRDARLAARQNLTSLLRTIANAQARVDVQLAAVAAAEEDLRVMQQRYELGASTLLDLLTSQTQLNQARTALIQARLDARTAGAQLESLIGRELQ